jgi:hypothetical protein
MQPFLIMGVLGKGCFSLDLRPACVRTSPRERIEFVSQGPTVWAHLLCCDCVNKQRVTAIRVYYVVLALSLLMSYIYGAPCKARNVNVAYIWTYVWQR